MNDINDKNDTEKRMLYNWGTHNSAAYSYQDKNGENDSYFIERMEEGSLYITEYGFETLPEVAKILDDLWSGDALMGEIRRVVQVATLKNKPLKQSALKENNLEITEEIPKAKKTEDKLPAFIYNF